MEAILLAKTDYKGWILLERPFLHHKYGICVFYSRKMKFIKSKQREAIFIRFLLFDDKNMRLFELRERIIFKAIK
jgi:hypothetical protein